MKHLLITFVFIFVTPAFAKVCNENRMGLDIGSGSTKMMVAEVDICSKKIIKILVNESRSVGYNDDYEKSKDQSITKAMEDKGLAALEELIALGKVHKPKKTKGVATSVLLKS